MELLMKVNINKERNMEKASLLGQMEAPTPVIFMIIIFTEQVSMNGLMEEYSMVNGRIIKWKAMEHLHGLMDVNM
jgi:hypothetical protein